MTGALPARGGHGPETQGRAGHAGMEHITAPRTRRREPRQARGAHGEAPPRFHTSAAAAGEAKPPGSLAFPTMSAAASPGRRPRRAASAAGPPSPGPSPHPVRCLCRGDDAPDFRPSRSRPFCRSRSYPLFTGRKLTPRSTASCRIGGGAEPALPAAGDHLHDPVSDLLVDRHGAIRFDAEQHHASRISLTAAALIAGHFLPAGGAPPHGICDSGHRTNITLPSTLAAPPGHS